MLPGIKAVCLSNVVQVVSDEFWIPVDDAARKLFVFPEHQKMMEIDLLDKKEDKTSPLAFGFAFHTCYWQVLWQVYSCYGSHVDLPHLFDLCVTLPFMKELPEMILDWGHDYKGLISPITAQRDVYGNESRPRSMFTIMEVLSQNPFYNPNLHLIFSTTRPYKCGQQATPKPPQRAEGDNNDGDPFSGLCETILEMILTFLDWVDVKRLRRASRAFTVTPLSNRFWHSRFWPGNELDFIWEAGAFREADMNWKAIYRRIHLLAQQGELGNRQRVWKLARRLRELTETRKACHECSGTPVPRKNGVATEYAWICLRRMSRAANMGPMRAKATTLENTSESIRDHPEVYVSTVKINSKTYVSGIRLSYKDYPGSRLGYCCPDRETKVTWEPPLLLLRLNGFHVSMDSRGIRGLRVIPQTGPPSRWVGEFDGLAHGPVVFPTLDGLRLGIKMLIADFDVGSPDWLSS